MAPLNYLQVIVWVRHGTFDYLQVIVWARHGTFDKKQSLGEAVVRLDGLDLMQHAFNWYKLFKTGATEFGSNESVNMW